MPETFDFSEALKRVKQGAKIARIGWNGNGMNIGLGEIEGMEPFLIIKSPVGTFNTWVPSISDLFAEDWLILKEEK